MSFATLRLYFLPTCKSCADAIRTFDAYVADATTRGLALKFEKIDARSLPKGTLYAQYQLYDVPALVFLHADGSFQSYTNGIKNFTLKAYQVLFG